MRVCFFCLSVPKYVTRKIMDSFPREHCAKIVVAFWSLPTTAGRNYAFEQHIDFPNGPSKSGNSMLPKLIIVYPDDREQGKSEKRVRETKTEREIAIENAHICFASSMNRLFFAMLRCINDERGCRSVVSYHLFAALNIYIPGFRRSTTRVLVKFW